MDIVKQAIKIFTELGMMDVLDDGTLFMNEVEKMIGYATQDEHTRESTRLRVQAFRERQKQLQIEGKRYSNVTCNGEIEIEKEIEKELEIETKKERINYQKIVDIYNNTCVSFPRVSILSDSRKKAIKKMLDKYTIEDFELMLKKAEASRFLKGAGDSNWSANFDWMIKDSNMVKILDGNYDERPKQNKVAEQLEQSYEMMSRWAEENNDDN